MHIRFLRICLLLCGMMALFGSAVIIPINIHGTSLLSHDTHDTHNTHDTHDTHNTHE
jgi:hypothetical protein